MFRIYITPKKNREKTVNQRQMEKSMTSWQPPQNLDRSASCLISAKTFYIVKHPDYLESEPHNLYPNIIWGNKGEG